MPKPLLIKKNRCIKCGSTLTYFRLKTKERVCRSCGKSWKPKGE